MVQSLPATYVPISATTTSATKPGQYMVTPTLSKSDSQDALMSGECKLTIQDIYKNYNDNKTVF